MAWFRVRLLPAEGEKKPQGRKRGQPGKRGGKAPTEAARAFWGM